MARFGDLNWCSSPSHSIICTILFQNAISSYGTQGPAPHKRTESSIPLPHKPIKSKIRLLIKLAPHITLARPTRLSSIRLGTTRSAREPRTDIGTSRGGIRIRGICRTSPASDWHDPPIFASSFDSLVAVLVEIGKVVPELLVLGGDGVTRAHGAESEG